MKRKKGLIRPWLFIGLIILVVFSLSGVGLVLAYKNGKFAQAQNPASNPSSADEVTPPDITITKTVPTQINQGDPFNITLDIPGMKDASSQVIPADVMFVIDSSQSMDRHAFPNKCLMYVNNDPTQPVIRWHAQRLCYAKTAAVRLMEMAANRNMPLKVGYQLFSNYDKTLPNYDSENSFYRFMGLTDINDDSARADLEAKLIGPCTGQNCQMPKPLGSAMGLGIEKAVRELTMNGNPNANKYIILLSDGKENVSPSVSGCRLGQWPINWPPDSSGCIYRYDNLTEPWKNIVHRLYNFQHQQERLLIPEMVYPLARQRPYDYCVQQGRSPCNYSIHEVNIYSENERYCIGGWRPAPIVPGPAPPPLTGLECVKFHTTAWYPGSPADQVQKNGIKVFSVGYYGTSGEEINPEYMQEIARHLYSPQEPGEISGYYDAGQDSTYLYQIVEDILGVVSNQYNGAPFTMVETLPLGASVAKINISISRGGVNLNPAISFGQNAGRQTITFNTNGLPNYGYDPQKDPNLQTFTVRIQNIQYSCNGNFDADQNYDPVSLNPLNPMPSYVTWTFPLSNPDNPKTEPMPKGIVRCVNQYSGDIYGSSIGNYAFPGIDVSVAKGVNSSTGAVWSLEHYNFSGSAYLNYGDFRVHFDRVIKDLEKRAKKLRSLDTIFDDTNPDPDLNPEGAVWHATGNLANLTITGPKKTIGKEKNQRATVIVDGNLVFNEANIAKLKPSNNNLLFIVKGSVTINASTTALKNIAIIAPYNNITVGDSKMDIEGLLAAKNVVLEGGTTSGPQIIHYDTSFAIYPPPGLSSFDLPIFKEVKP